MQNSSLRAVFYTSKSCLAARPCSGELAELIEAAQRKNAALGITGALILVGQQFAQYIEGPATAVHSLMASIAADARHKNMLITYDQFIAERRLCGWSLAYKGPSLYMSKHMEAITNSDGLERQQNVHRMLRLIAGLAAPSPTDTNDWEQLPRPLETSPLVVRQ